ncbi:DUF748 domain-containing protein [Thalassotalea ganghwensis]
MVKVIASILVIVLLALGGALWFIAGGSLNDFVKAQIESVGQQVTEQKVSVELVDIRLSEGAGTIKGLNLPNPQGYGSQNAFTLGESTLDINLESLTKTPIVLDAIIIKNPSAYIQVTKDGNSNIKDLIDAIKRNTGTSTATKEENASGKEPFIAVDKVVLAGTQLTLDLTDLGNKVHQLTLHDINLNGIGGKTGLPASQLGSEIIKQALSELWKQAKKEQEGIIKEKIKAKVDEKVEELKESAKDKLKEEAKKKLGKLFDNE